MERSQRWVGNSSLSHETCTLYEVSSELSCSYDFISVNNNNLCSQRKILCNNVRKNTKNVSSSVNYDSLVEYKVGVCEGHG